MSPRHQPAGLRRKERATPPGCPRRPERPSACSHGTSRRPRRSRRRPRLTARRRPPSKTVARSAGPMAQNPLGSVSSDAAVELATPPPAVSESDGKKAACATPICAFAAATRRSAAAMSGRRSMSSRGQRGRNRRRCGCDGTFGDIDVRGRPSDQDRNRVFELRAGDMPSRSACTRVVSSCVCACATSTPEAMPWAYRACVNCSARS